MAMDAARTALRLGAEESIIVYRRSEAELPARAEEVEPENYELWNLKGFCHFKQRKHDEAIACFEKAIEIDPSSGIDYANIASNLRDKGDTEGAIVMYQKALSLDPTIQFARESLERLQKSRTT